MQTILCKENDDFESELNLIFLVHSKREKLNFWIKFKWKKKNEKQEKKNFKEHNSINLNFQKRRIFYVFLWLQHTNTFPVCVLTLYEKKEWIKYIRVQKATPLFEIRTYLIISGRRSITFGCECFLAFDGVNPTVQANINSVESSTGIWGDFSSGSWMVDWCLCGFFVSFSKNRGK